MKKHFLIVEDALPGKKAFPIGGRLAIGRGADNDVRLFGYDVSRRHAEIRVIDGRPVIVDLGSRNGTFVNGERIDRAALTNGDRVRIGSTHIEIFKGAPPVETDPEEQTVLNAVASGRDLAAMLEKNHGLLGGPEAQALRALIGQLEKGCEIQRDFLPRSLPEVDGWEISACYQPALRVGGDFYDFFQLPSGLLAFAIADVCDKGVGAAQFVSVIRTLLRLFAGDARMELPLGADENRTAGLPDGDRPEHDRVLAKALQAVNLSNHYLLREHGELCMYATLFFGVLDPKTGQLSYINAGHEPLFVLAPEGIRAALKPTGLPVGMQPEGVRFDIRNIGLAAGQMLLGYTDGLIDAETKGGELFSRKRLAALLGQPFSSAGRLIDALKSELSRHLEGNPPPDDITLIAIRRKAG
jgi:sigma-B regulation protein RsbU (phosphoserine phosphatase)